MNEQYRQTEGPDLSTVECPDCGTTGSLYVGETLTARPIGSFSLAGAQMKVSANTTPALRCSTDGCGFVKLPSGGGS